LLRPDNSTDVQRLKTAKKMKKLILMLLMAECCLMTAHAQKTVVSQTNQKVFDTVEQMPEYPGGMQAMIAFLQTNMKYPEDAAKQKVEGRVMVQFIVETDGSISDVHVAKQVFPSLDAEAIRVVQAMPKWTPGKEKGNVVRVKYNLPIVFRM
jgi:protein TonB